MKRSAPLPEPDRRRDRSPGRSTAALFCGLALLLAVFALFSPPAAAQSLAESPRSGACVSFTTPCSGSTGVCTGPIPDGGSDAGVPAAYLRAYYLYSCPPRFQTITATGAFNNYHCHGRTGECPIVPSNTQSITAATTNPEWTLADGGRAGGQQGCWESSPFEVPYAETYNAADRMVWVPNGITVTPTDGGVLTTYVCPAR